MNIAFRRILPGVGIMSKLEEALDLSPEEVDIVAIEWFYAIFAANYFSERVYFAPKRNNPERSERRIDLNAPIFVTVKLRRTGKILMNPAKDPDRLLRKLILITGEREACLRAIARTILSMTIAHRDNGLVLYEQIRRGFGSSLNSGSPRAVSRRIIHPKIY